MECKDKPSATMLQNIIIFAIENYRSIMSNLDYIMRRKTIFYIVFFFLLVIGFYYTMSQLIPGFGKIKTSAYWQS
jgi:hypothetical protein